MALMAFLVWSWVGMSVLLSNLGDAGLTTLVGALCLGLLQLAALWYFRGSLPASALSAIRVIPPVPKLARWTLFAVVGGGLLQLLGNHFTATSDMLLEPLTRYWAGWLLAVVVLPLVEEILFRACLFEFFRPMFPIPVALLISAAIFGLGHGPGLLGVAFAFCGGLVFGAAYLRSDSIVPGFIGHAVVNAAGLIAISNGLS